MVISWVGDSKYRKLASSCSSAPRVHLRGLAGHSPPVAPRSCSPGSGLVSGSRESGARRCRSRGRRGARSRLRARSRRAPARRARLALPDLASATAHTDLHPGAEVLDRARDVATARPAAGPGARGRRRGRRGPRRRSATRAAPPQHPALVGDLGVGPGTGPGRPAGSAAVGQPDHEGGDLVAAGRRRPRRPRRRRRPRARRNPGPGPTTTSRGSRPCPSSSRRRPASRRAPQVSPPTGARRAPAAEQPRVPVLVERRHGLEEPEPPKRRRGQGTGSRTSTSMRASAPRSTCSAVGPPGRPRPRRRRDRSGRPALGVDERCAGSGSGGRRARGWPSTVRAAVDAVERDHTRPDAGSLNRQK